jgi:ribosomal protein S18 acetylase RimI-like enzyme
VIRRATVADAAAIARLEPWPAEELASTLALPTTRAWVADRDAKAAATAGGWGGVQESRPPGGFPNDGAPLAGSEGAATANRIVGDVIASAVDGVGEIVLIAVDPQVRREGIGTALLGAVEAGWRDEGVTDAWLEVRADNAPAIALYRANGWAEAGVRSRYYRDGTDALRMRRSLR